MAAQDFDAQVSLNGSYIFGKNLTFGGRWQGIVDGSDFDFLYPFKFVDDRAEITLTAINERQVAYEGQRPLTINDGYEMEPFQLAIAGRRPDEIGMFFGQNQASFPLLTVGQQIDNFGFFILNGFTAQDNGTVTASIYVGNLSARVLQVPASTRDTDTNWIVEIYSDNPKVRVAGEGYTIVAETWYDNTTSGGTVTNANAPDGILTTAVLGTGNGSFQTPTTPVANTIITSGTATTSWKDYFIDLKSAALGSTMNDVADTVTFTVGSSTITWPAAPADETIVTAVYMVVDSNDDAPNMDQINTSTHYWYDALRS